jgi:hypothetical protein
LEREDRAESVERLLQEGLDLYQSGLIDHAIAVWTEVLHVEPDEPRALEYLRQAGMGGGEGESLAPAEGVAAATPRAELEQLLGERRYEEALELLFALRRQDPESQEISRGVQLLKQRLVRRYLHQIGNLDHVPTLALDAGELEAHGLGEDARELLRLVDGISSFGDIAHESRLGRFETYRLLARLVGEHVLTATGSVEEQVPTPTGSAEEGEALADAEAAPAPRARSARCADGPDGRAGPAGPRLGLGGGGRLGDAGRSRHLLVANGRS